MTSILIRGGRVIDPSRGTDGVADLLVEDGTPVRTGEIVVTSRYMALGYWNEPALTATAFGGGWATVGMSSTPAGAKPGEPWVVDMTILQHGRTPLEGVRESAAAAER